MTLQPPPQIKIIRGDGTTLNFTFFTLDTDGETHIPIDLTGKTLFFTAKPDFDEDDTDAEAVISKEVIVHTNPSGGISDVVLTKIDTAVSPGFYVWDCQLLTPGGSPTSTLAGRMQVYDDVTRRLS